MSTNQWFNDVQQFHREKQPYSNHRIKPGLIPEKEALVEAASLMQEVSELTGAMAVGNLPEIADGAIDSIYVLLGLLSKYGIDPEPIWQEVQRSNMDKLPAGPGTLGRKTIDGKSCKPEGWVGPRVAEILLHQGW